MIEDRVIALCHADSLYEAARADPSYVPSVASDHKFIDPPLSSFGLMECEKAAKFALKVLPHL